jgi:hypothetical protein
MNCVKCSASLPQGAAFCAGCGTKQPLPEASPEQLQTYREALKSFMDDGVLEDWEQTELERLRAELSITSDAHNELMNEFKLGMVVPLELFVDTASMKSFQQDQRCLIRMRLLNPSDRPLKSVGIRYVTSATNGLMTHDTSTVPPQKFADFYVGIQPSAAGQHTLEGVLNSNSMTGKVTHYQLKPVAFQVDAHQEGPQSVSVNIDASSMKVGSFDDWNLTGADTESRAGLMPDGQWLHVKLNSVSPERADSWSEKKSGSKAAITAADRKAQEEADAERRRIAIAEQQLASSSDLDKGRLDLDAQRQAHEMDLEKRRLKSAEEESKFARDNSLAGLLSGAKLNRGLDEIDDSVPEDPEQIVEKFMLIYKQYDSIPSMPYGGAQPTPVSAKLKAVMKALIDQYEFKHHQHPGFDRNMAFMTKKFGSTKNIFVKFFEWLLGLVSKRDSGT